jgi:NADH-ubiquinone oxidoreductase chain 5
LAAGCTAYYSVRLIYLTFIRKTSSVSFILKDVHEASFFMFCVLFILALGSIFFGFLFKDLFVGLGSDIIFFS